MQAEQEAATLGQGENAIGSIPEEEEQYPGQEESQGDGIIREAQVEGEEEDEEEYEQQEPAPDEGMEPEEAEGEEGMDEEMEGDEEMVEGRELTEEEILQLQALQQVDPEAAQRLYEILMAGGQLSDLMAEVEGEDYGQEMEGDYEVEEEDLGQP